ncbi:MAG: hypothetical protein IJ767_03780, partial [Bacteroidaceae bacterium]|nr:hypothetical protein [Bacteroidaceae bacterium]
ESAYREKNAEGGMIDLATVDGSSQRAYIDATLQAPTEAYEAAFAALAAYLNRGTAWAEPATYKSPLAASDFPALLKVTDNVEFLDKWDGTGQEDDGRTFRNLWAALTASQVKLANAMATLNTNKADAAQETADNLADDGIISGGDEKLKLWIEWKRVLNERSHLIEQVADYNHATTGRLTIISTTTKILAATRTAATTLKANLSNAYASYEAALIGVGKYLDGVVSNGSYVEAQAGHFYNYAEDTVSWNNTPYVISDSQRAIDTKGISAVTYRSRWNAYYVALTTLYQYLSDAGALCVKASQDTANTALDRISAMVADGMINVSEKQDLRAEYVNAWNQMHCAGGIRDRARDANGNYLPATTIGGVSYNCLSLYNEWFQSFENLSEALNDGEQWDSRDLTTASDGTISASDPMLPYEINAEEGGLYEDWEVTDADAFRALWATLYQSTTKLETAIAKVTKYIADNAKAGVDNIFSNDVLTPEELRIIRREFHAMCIEWMNPNTGLYAQAKALEETSDSGYEFDWGDWGDLSELGSLLHNGVSWYLGEITITSSTVSESDTPDWIKTVNLENTIDLSTAIVTVRNNWGWMDSVLKDGNSWLSGRAALEKLWRLAQVETEALRKEIEEERAAQAKAGAISEAASADAAIRAAIAATIPKIFNYEKGVVTPTNYKVGDTWINVVAQPNAVALHDPTATASPYTKSMTLDKQALVCISDYSGSFSWSDWQLLDQYLYASFKTNEDGLSSLAGRVTSAETTIRSHTTRIGQNADAISAVATRTTTVEGKVSTLESAGFITSADWATLFAQKQTNGEVVSRAQITAMTDSIKLEVQGSVEEDINPGDNLLEYAELESMDELEDYWTLTTYGSTDQAAATAALNGSIITRAGVREGLFPILRVNMRQATLTAESGSPNVTIAQTIPTDVLQSFSGNTITLSVYLRKSTTYSDQLFGMFARNCANISVSEWTGDNISMPHTNELIDNTTQTRYTQFNINDTEWHRLHIVITLSDKTVATEIFFRFWKSNNQSTGNMWYFSSPKLEAGSKPTRWIVEKSVIDITRNQIVLDSKTVKVARDLTIGGNAHIGGFIYNEPTILTVDKVRICCNPFDYGCLDRALAKAAYTDSAPYKTNNIVFPEFGSSVEITDAIGDVFTTANHRDRLQVMLPFWHFYNASSRNPMDYPATIFADLNSKTWTEDSVTKSWSTMTDKTTKQLLSWIQSGYNICRQYIDTVVTITNSLSSIYDDNDVWIYGIKGVIPILYSGHHYNSINLSSIIDYYEVEPWNRSTIRWSFADYNSSGTETSAHRFNSGNCWPKTDEAKWMIGNLSFSRLDFSSHRVMQGSWGSTNRQYDNDTVWALAAQLGSEEFFSGIDDTSTDLQAGASAVCSTSQIPFILPKGCFVRLRCVFQDGFFFWEPIAMGSIDKN